MTAEGLTRRQIEGLYDAAGTYRVQADPLSRIALASDAGFYRLIPRAVVRPADLDSIKKLFAFCRREALPLTFRAAGTSLSGQAVTDGILVDLSRGWTGISVESGGGLVRLQPGVIGGFANRVLSTYCRRIGPDPASIDACMIGGILANNASGMCCGVAENAYHTLHSMRFLLPDGSEFDSGAPDAARRFKEEAPRVAEGLIELRARILAQPRLRERIRDKYKLKNTMGYSLNAFLDYEAPHEILSHLLVGSEGTLAFIAEAVLDTLPAYPFKYTGLLVFKDIPTACGAIESLKTAGARAVEIMDRASLRSVQDLPGAVEDLRHLPADAAALLVEFQCGGRGELEDARRTADRTAGRLPLLLPARFTDDPDEQAALWTLRKGLYPSVGAMRPSGATALIEDVLFPPERLAEAVTGLQDLFRRHGFDEAIIFGHARDGNLHFVLTPSFGSEDDIGRYARFMDDLAALVVHRYDGALKAEHGTGRNMAPFLETEWGKTARDLMADLKSLIDPDGILNPGVILNDDPEAHIRHLKSFPKVEEVVDRCTECGFCERQCPSRRLTLTPRQRIVVRRELARLEGNGGGPGLKASLDKAFEYDGLDTCAADGLCALACPVGIDTGALVKHLRAVDTSALGRWTAGFLSRHFAASERALRTAVRLARVLSAAAGPRALAAAAKGAEILFRRRFPKWHAAIPGAAPGRLPEAEHEKPEAVYFPSCLSRTLGSAPPGGPPLTLAESMLVLAERAGVGLRIPPDSPGHCCGMPFHSKGYTDASREILSRTVSMLWSWSDGGRLPVVVDASSCAYSLKSAEPQLEEEALARWRDLTFLDGIEFVHDVLLPLLTLEPLQTSVAVHPNCAARKQGLEGKLESVARCCARDVIIPWNLECCATAGDRGLLFPELSESALRPELEELSDLGPDACYSTNLTCEMGLGRASGRRWLSWLYLVERASRPLRGDARSES
ncbi:MAG: FAD-binding and (Fe-S)-binding domain-containing protein [Acidobacteriota bacterium]